MQSMHPPTSVKGNMSVNYCAACRSRQVPVVDAVCEKCALAGHEPGRPAYHAIDGFALLQKTVSVLNGAVEAMRDRVDQLAKTSFASLTKDERIERDFLFKSLSDLGRSAGMVSKEIRAYEREIRQKASNLTKAEKLQIIPAFFEQLSPDEQKSLIQQLMQQYNNRSGFKVQERKKV